MRCIPVTRHFFATSGNMFLFGHDVAVKGRLIALSLKTAWKDIFHVA